MSTPVKKKEPTISELISNKETQIKNKKELIKENQKLLRKLEKQLEMLEFKQWKNNKS